MFQTQAMLANLNISQWTARKHDKRVTSDVESKHSAKDAGRFNKLLIEKVALEPISKIVSAARLHHYKITLPWGDNGDRLLPSKLFLSYTQSMRQYKDEFNMRADAFATNYPGLVQTERVRLGSLYDPNDYPATTDIRNRFQFNTTFTPVPDANDFRVDVAAEDAERIKADITAMVQCRQQEAVKECWARVKDVLERYTARLADEKAIFRDSLVENAQDLVDLLPSLNITNDPTLDATTQEIRDKLLRYSPQRLRYDVAVRADVAKAASELLAKLPW